MDNNKKPDVGDQYKCNECGMEVLITEPCKCTKGEPFFTCCDKQMSLVESQSK